jgi:hypothetical protein
VISDPVKRSVYLKELEEGFREDYNRRYKNLLKSNPSAAKALIEKRVNQDLEPYKNMEEADGAGYITFDAYRTLRKLQGIWEQEHEDLYQKVLDAYNTGKEINRAEVVRMFPVYKLQHYGHLMNAKLPVVAMHKFALTPIIPTVFRNSDLERIHNQMIDQGIQYITFATGSKVGAITSNGQPDVIFEDDNTTLKSNIKFTPNVINVKNLKEATPVPDKYKGQVVFMTQMRKMIS